MAQVRIVHVDNSNGGAGVILLENGDSGEDASFIIQPSVAGAIVSFELLGKNDDDSDQTLGSGWPLNQNDLPFSVELAAGERVRAAANPAVDLRVLRVRSRST